MLPLALILPVWALNLQVAFSLSLLLSNAMGIMGTYDNWMSKICSLLNSIMIYGNWSYYKRSKYADLVLIQQMPI